MRRQSGDAVYHEWRSLDKRLVKEGSHARADGLALDIFSQCSSCKQFSSSSGGLTSSVNRKYGISRVQIPPLEEHISHWLWFKNNASKGSFESLKIWIRRQRFVNELIHLWTSRWDWHKMYSAIKLKARRTLDPVPRFTSSSAVTKKFLLWFCKTKNCWD